MSRPLILVVDDEPLLVRAITAGLQTAGYDTLTAATGLQAARVMRSAPVELALIDLVMPDKDGIETIMEFRREWPQCRLIAMSGALFIDECEFLEVALLLGADAAIDKPFTFPALVRAIEVTLEPPERARLIA